MLGKKYVESVAALMGTRRMILDSANGGRGDGGRGGGGGGLSPSGAIGGTVTHARVD